MGGDADIPGLPPVPPLALPTPVMEKTKPECAWYAYHGGRFVDADGIVMNAAAELERGVLDAITRRRSKRGSSVPALYPVGPVICFPEPADPPHECVRWVRDQPPASVVFLCFGSGGYFTAAQAHEAACGLERSGHRFLCVLRGAPAPGVRSPADADLAELLPEGFVERTRDRGLAGAVEGDPRASGRRRLRHALLVEVPAPRQGPGEQRGRGAPGWVCAEAEAQAAGPSTPPL